MILKLYNVYENGKLIIENEPADVIGDIIGITSARIRLCARKNKPFGRELQYTAVFSMTDNNYSIFTPETREEWIKVTTELQKYF